jgi:hypothetical protein
MGLPGLSSTVVQIVMMLALASAYAAEAQENSVATTGTVLPTVTVGAPRNPVDKSYRKMLKGMDLFEEKHGLAPDASLRYKLLPRQRDTKMDGIVLEIVGNTVAIPVVVAADHTFTLDRHPQALDEDASVIPDRNARSMTWRAEIRTPGLPLNTRRLGDLRLECFVGMEADLVSNVRPVIGQVANFVLRMLGYCDGRVVHYLFFSEHPLFGVTMVAGNRREVLSVDELYAGASYDPALKADLPYCDCQVMLDRTFFMPLGDPTWPDDTLVEFEYMEDGVDGQTAVTPHPPAPSVATAISARNARDAITVGISNKADVIATLGKTTVISFDSGFEVWVYRFKADSPTATSWAERFGFARSDKGKSGNTEFVILFAQSGVVTKARVRDAPPPVVAKDR